MVWTIKTNPRLQTSIYREPVGGVWGGGVVPGDVVAATPKRCSSAASYSGKSWRQSGLLWLQDSWEARHGLERAGVAITA